LATERACRLLRVAYRARGLGKFGIGQQGDDGGVGYKLEQQKPYTGGDLSRCSNVREQSCGYSITSSARASSLSGGLAKTKLPDLAALSLEIEP
jgi:hypothetical protein